MISYQNIKDFMNIYIENSVIKKNIQKNKLEIDKN